MTERLQKLISRAGICSRRAAETLLTEGRVTVNGMAAQLGDKADPETDAIAVDGKPLTFAGPMVYLMLNKPRGYVTTLSDELGRATAAELVADCGARVFPVGRLDRDSEGLLLFTNDGALMQAMTHPRHQVDKVYEVTVTGALEGAAQRLAAVTELGDGTPVVPAQVEAVWQKGGQALLRVPIHQGKNRQIRRMCRALDFHVMNLKRVRIMDIKLGNLKRGEYRELTKEELSGLMEAVKDSTNLPMKEAGTRTAK